MVLPTSVQHVIRSRHGVFYEQLFCATIKGVLSTQDVKHWLIKANRDEAIELSHLLAIEALNREGLEH
jgi:hypothetical protein